MCSHEFCGQQTQLLVNLVRNFADQCSYLRAPVAPYGSHEGLQPTHLLAPSNPRTLITNPLPPTTHTLGYQRSKQAIYHSDTPDSDSPERRQLNQLVIECENTQYQLVALLP